MAWFKVDDGLHDHRKARAVRRSHPDKRRDVAPFGLWVLAGSWVGGNGTTGFVPTEVLEEWDDQAAELAQRLVVSGFWWETEQDGEPGFGFHDWQDYLPRTDGILDSSSSGKLGNHIKWHAQRGMRNSKCEFCAEHRGDIGGDARPDAKNVSPPNREPVPTRPDPTDTSASADAERTFDEWWQLYPRKRSKGSAVKAYKGAAKKVSPTVLLASLRQQLPTLTAKGADFIPYPATWLNGERWLDQPDAAVADIGDLKHVNDIAQPPDGLTDEQYRDWWQNQRLAR